MPEQKNLSLNAGAVGSATLVAGTASVTLASVRSNTVIFLSAQNTGGIAGTLSVVITAGVGFVINSSNALDTRIVSYMVTVPIAPPPPPFSPPDIAGLTVWLKADAAVFSDAGITPAVNLDPVQQWNDQSGNANNVSQAIAASRPQFLSPNLNGLPTIKTDGVDDILQASFSPLAQPNTLFVVMNIYAGVYLISGASTVGPGFGEIAVAGTYTLNSGNNSVGYVYGTLPEGFKAYTLLSGSSARIAINDSTVASGDSGTSVIYDGLSLGGVNAFRSEIDFAEVVLYDSALSTVDQTRVINYLMQKWGL